MASLSLPHHMRTQWEGNLYKKLSGPLQRPCWHPDLRLPASRAPPPQARIEATWENENAIQNEYGLRSMSLKNCKNSGGCVMDLGLSEESYLAFSVPFTVRVTLNLFLPCEQAHTSLV